MPREKQRLVDRVRAHANGAGERIAIEQGERAVTYRELARMVDERAAALREAGAACAFVALERRKSAAFVADFLAVLAAGGTVVPLDPDLPPDRRATFLELARPAFAVSDSGIVRLGGSAAPPVLEDGLCVYFTSGSTGRLKPVLSSAAGLLRFIDWFWPEFGIGVHDRFAHVAGPSFEATLREVFPALVGGATLVVPERADAASPEATVAWLARTGVTTLTVVPSVARTWLRHGQATSGAVRAVFFVGEPLAADVVSGWRAAFPRTEVLVNSYGSTETGQASICRRVLPGDEPTENVPAGRPVPGTRYCLIEPGSPLDAAAVRERLARPAAGGEIVIVSGSCSHGYLGLPEEHAARFADLGGGVTAYRTGDLGRVDEHGELVVKGRVDDEIKINGVRVHPAEVTRAIRGHAAVRDAFVTATRAGGTARLTAYVVAADGQTPAAALLRRDLVETLPPAMIPAGFVEVSELPRTRTGKIDRAALVRLAEDGPAPRHVAPSGEVERWLAGQFAELLGVERPSATDDLFALGGDSIVAMRLASRIAGDLGVELSQRAIFGAATIAGIAAAIGEGRARAADAIPRIDRSSGRLPMSFAQRRLAFLQRLAPDGAAYNVVQAVRVRGPLDAGGLRAALDTVAARHEVLRTRCAFGGAEPELVLGDGPGLEVVAGGSMAAVEADFARRADLPFDLEREPPLRATLARLAADDHALLLVAHHLASDAWSCRLLLDELFRAYAGAPHEELAVQYADHAAWQRAASGTADMDAHVAYWRERLAGMPPVLELPLDGPRPPVRSDRGAEVRLALRGDVRGRLVAAARVASVTPFALLLTAFAFVLHRYCATDDVVVGTPVSGRDRVEVEPLLGCFVNTVVLRLDLGLHGAPSRRELVRRLWARTLADLEHRALPFERLVAELNPERDLGVGQLVQALFNLYPAPGLGEPESGLDLEPIEVARSRAKFDLACEVVDDGDAMRVTLTYATDLLDGGLVARMGDHLVAVLDALVADLDAPASTLPHAPTSDPRPLSAVAGARSDVPALGRFEAHASAHPDRVAVRCRDNAITYEELDRRAGRLAGRLLDRTSAPVALLFERSIDAVVAMLAALKAGLPYVPLDPVMPEGHVAEVCRAAGAELLLTSAEASGGAGGRPAGPCDAMYVLFTSGSTGRPKGVVVEHRHFTRYLDSLVDRLALPDGLHFAMASTFAADLGLTNVYGALTTGGTLHVLPYEWATDPERFAAYCRRHPIDVMKLVPSHLQAIAEDGALRDVVPARHLILAGEACPWDLVAAARAARPGCAIWNHYGPTETTVSVLAYPVPEVPPSPRGVTVPLGFPLGHARVHVVDGRLRPVPVGAPGELLIAGESVARGYLSPEEGAGDRFVRDPFSADPEARAYRSGDRARIRPDGSVEFLGRLDRQAKIRGHRVEPSHVEAVLRRHPAVAEVAVAVRDDRHGRSALVAYWVPDPPGAGADPPLADFARSAMPPHLVPSAFVQLDSLPLTPNGKIDWRALPEPAAEAPRDRPPAPPRDALDERVAGAWREALGVELAGIDDDFFASGGDSFAAMRLARAIGVRVVSVFQHPTIRRLADLVRAGEAGGLLCRLPGRSGGAAAAVTATVVAVPFGGGTAAAFGDLARALPPDFPLYALELPGHDAAAPAGALEPFETITRRCVEEIRRAVRGPVVVYGHCVGAALAFDVARRLEAEAVEVVGVVAGGAFPAPRLPGAAFDLWARVVPSDRWRSDRLYRDLLRALGGLGDGEEEASFSPAAVRHDARESEDVYTRLCHDPARRRTVHALAVVGERDRITEFHGERYREWNLLCADAELAVIPDAGHYFLKHQAERLAAEVVGWTRRRLAGETTAASAAVPTSNLRGFGLVTLGQLVSLSGTRALAFALGIWVYLQTGSVTQFSVILVTALLPGLLALPFAGAAADRWDRRRLMVLGELANGAAAGLCLVAFATGSLQVWHIYLAASLGSIGASFQQPAYVAAVTQLVPKQYLSRTSGIMQAVVAVSQIAGPLLGGTLIVLVGPGGVMALALATVGAALATLGAVRFPDLLFRTREETVWQEIGGGLRYIARRRGFVAMIVFFLGYNLVLGFALALVPPMVLSFASAGTLSVATMVGAAGGIAGGVGMALWGGFARRATGMVGFAAVTGAGMIVAGLRPWPALPVVGLAAMMASTALINGHWQTMIQVKVGTELQGRILATNRMIANLTEPLGYVGAGWLADAFLEPAMARGGWLSGTFGAVVGAGPGRGMALLLVALGCAHVALAAAGLRWRTLRRMEDALPDAVPGAVVTWDRDALQRQADARLAGAVTPAGGSPAGSSRCAAAAPPSPPAASRRAR